MQQILLSINPEHVTNILNKTKKYEYRKVKSTKKIDKIYIYCTSPVMKVIGEVEVVDVLFDSKKNIWNLTKDFSGISEHFFNEYYLKKDKAVAYKLGEIIEYSEPKSLLDFGLKQAPQSYVYISKDT